MGAIHLVWSCGCQIYQFPVSVHH